MQDKKVLIILREFLPYCNSLGTALRVLKMAEFFVGKGIEVIILSAKGQQTSYFGYEEEVRKLNVHYLPDLLQYNNTKNYHLKSKRNGRTQSHIEALVKKIRHLIDEISTPDVGIYFVKKYFRQAIGIVNKHHIRNVIVSSPQHSTQVIGLMLKRRLSAKINLIVDYRDSWNTTRVFQKSTFIFKMLSESLEKKILQAADHFVYCSPPILGKINSKFFDITHKSLLVMNGFDPTIGLNTQKILPKNECLTIGHFGSIVEHATNFRNPALFFEALLNLNRKIKIVFYGAVHISESWQDRLKGIIEIRGNVSHRQALDSMQRMDVLMLLHSEREGADEVLTSKLFEYMYIQRPILVVGPEDMEAARIVTNYGLGYCINLYDQEDIVNKMNAIYEQWQTASLTSYKIERLKEFSRPHQYSKMLDILQ